MALAIVMELFLKSGPPPKPNPAPPPRPPCSRRASSATISPVVLIAAIRSSSSLRGAAPTVSDCAESMQDA